MKNKVTQNPDDEVSTEIIASSIRDIAMGMKRINAGRLNRKAITVLLNHASGVTQKEITLVLDAMAQLETLYLRKK